MGETINKLIELYQSKDGEEANANFKNEEKDFCITKKQIGNFMDGVCGAVIADLNEEKDLYSSIGYMELKEEGGTYNHFGHEVCEIATNNEAPVIMDFIFKLNPSQIIELDDESTPILYNEKFIISMIFSVQQALVANLEIGDKLAEISVLVEKSPLWHDGNHLCFKIMLIFPYCHVNIDYQNETIRDLCIEVLKYNSVLGNLSVEYVGGWEDFLIPITTNIPMYRGKGSSNVPPCTFMNIYGPLSDRDTQEGAKVTPHKLDSSFFNLMQSGAIRGNNDFKEVVSKDVSIDYWYPILRSIHFWQTVSGPKIYSLKATPENNIPMNYGGSELQISVDSDNPKDILHFLMPLLIERRYIVEPYLHDVAQCIHSIYDGEHEGLQFLLRYTNQYVDEEKITNLYEGLLESNLTVKTIACYAKEDNPERYYEWHDAWCEISVYDAFNCLHDSVAKVVYRMFWLDFIWIGDNRWMEFHQHSLREQSNACNLREAIRITMVGKYTDIRKKYQAAASTSDSQLDVKQNEECAKKATALISKLSNYSYKNTIVKSAQPFFEIRNFSSIRDSNPCKTGWKNCVVTCYKEHAYISNGKLEDFITKTTHKKYNKDLSWGHPIVVELKNWFSQMFPDQELMKYMFRDMSSYLYGRNSEKILRAWCGDGNNSKTMLAKCIQEAFGSYSIDFPPSFLTAKALGSSGPNPELAQAQGAHIGFVPETEDDEKVREGAVKRATGGDRQFARNLNENGGSMEMGCKIVLMCNKIPEFTSISKALVARFVNIPFLGNWSDEAPTLLADQIEQNHYKMDPLFEERIPELSVALAWAAVQYYPVYKKEGLTSPSIIKRYTRQHWEDNDPVLCFVQERVENVYKIGENGEKIPDSNASLSCSQIYTVYKSWFGQRYPGTTPSAMNAFKVNLELQMGKAGPSKKWGGVAIVQMIANVSEGRSGNGNDMDNMNS